MDETAFPAQALGGLGYTTGMSLRDYFAAKAMAAFVVHTPYEKVLNNSGLSFDAYKLGYCHHIDGEVCVAHLTKNLLEPATSTSNCL